MTVYMLVQAHITDRERFGAYAKAAAALVGEFGGSYRVVGGAPELLEGDDHEQRWAISGWPDRAAAKRFWNSPEYTEVRKLREGTGSFTVTLVDTVDATQQS